MPPGKSALLGTAARRSLQGAKLGAQGRAVVELLERHFDSLGASGSASSGDRATGTVAAARRAVPCKPVRLLPGDVARLIPRAAPERARPFDDILSDVEEKIFPGLTPRMLHTRGGLVR